MKTIRRSRRRRETLSPATLLEDVAFYRANDPKFGCFSNLYRRAMEFEGRIYPTAEHAFQSAKPRKADVREWLMACPSPSLLALTAHAITASWDIAPGWSKTQHGRMLAVVRTKFTQHADLAEVLLSTGDARIVETPTVNDAEARRWGEVKGKGANWLGLILMQVRAELRQKEQGS